MGKTCENTLFVEKLIFDFCVEKIILVRKLDYVVC